MPQRPLIAFFGEREIPTDRENTNSTLEDNELNGSSVVKNYFTTAADDKNYYIVFYSFDIIPAIDLRRKTFRISSRSDVKRRMLGYKEVACSLLP